MQYALTALRTSLSLSQHSTAQHRPRAYNRNTKVQHSTAPKQINHTNRAIGPNR